MADLPASQELSDLIGQMYDAALDPSLWPRFLESLTNAFGAEQALLLNVDTEPAPGGLILPLNMDLGIVADWEGSKEHVDVWYQGVQRVQQDTVYCGRDLCSPRTLRKSPFYIDMLSPMDIEHTLGAISYESDARKWVFAIYHDSASGPFSERQKRTYELLIPHFGRAIRTSQVLGRLQSERDLLAESLEHSPFAVLILDRNDLIVGMNQRAENIATDCDGLTIRYGSLKFWDFQTETRFYSLVVNSTSATLPGDNRNRGYLRVARPSGKPDYHLMVSPLGSRSSTFVFPASGAVIVLIHDPSIPKAISAELLEQLYGLTVAEAQICVALFESGSLADAIDALKISRNTAKTHLTHIFEKLGVKSQAQLLQLLALGFRREPKAD